MVHGMTRLLVRVILVAWYGLIFDDDDDNIDNDSGDEHDDDDDDYDDEDVDDNDVMVNTLFWKAGA